MSRIEGNDLVAVQVWFSSIDVLQYTIEIYAAGIFRKILLVEILVSICKSMEGHFVPSTSVTGYP